MTAVLTPDSGEALRTWLGSVAEVTAITGTRIGITLTGPLPSIRYALLGGENVGVGAGWARYQVECWGTGNNTPDDGTSLLLARTVMDSAPTFVGRWANTTVAGATADYPYRQDDTTTGRPRHIVELAFTATP